MLSGIDLKEKKLPYIGFSKNLFEYFLIIGYDSSTIQNEIFNELRQSKYTPPELVGKSFFEKINAGAGQKTYNKFVYKEKPIVLNSISSNFDKEMLSEEMIINLVFPNTPTLYFTNQPRVIRDDPPSYSVTFFFGSDDMEARSKNIYHSYSHIFYEKITIEDKFKIYIPKAFCIISQWPYYSLFNSISKDVVRLFGSEKLEIPIEILLYNMLNFTPSPINNSLCLSLFPHNDLSYYAKNVKGNNQYTEVPQNVKMSNKQIIDQLTGYPIFDFNLSQIFNVLPMQIVIEILIFNLLEIDMLFFSKNLEILNLVMYIFSMLSYPCNDTIYLWHILSVPREDLTNQSKNSQFVGKPCSSMVGINCSYSENINTDKLYESCFIVDLEKKNFFYRHAPLDEEEDMKKIDKEGIENIKNLQAYIRKVLEGKKVQSAFLEDNIKELFSTLTFISKKVTFSNYSHTYQGPPKFFITEGTNLLLNKSTQEAFYNFLLNILKVFYNFYSFDSTSEINNKKMASRKGNDSFEDSTDEGKNKFFDLVYQEDFSSFSEEEKIFCQLFKNSAKYTNYIKAFLQDFDCLDLYKIPFLFSEEFISMKNSKNSLFNGHYFEVIDSFFNQKLNANLNNNTIISQEISTNIKYINFQAFYAFYDAEIKDYIFEEAKKCSHIKTNSSSAFQRKKFFYKYNYSELDNSFLFKYIHLLSELSSERLEEIFPSITIQKSNEIQFFHVQDISKNIEKSLVQYKALTSIDLIIISTILIIGIITENTEIEDNEVLDFIEYVISTQKFCIRRYVIIILSTYYRTAKKKIDTNSEKSTDLEFNVLDYLVGFLKSKNIVPNQQLLKLLNLFKELEQKKIELNKGPPRKNSGIRDKIKFFEKKSAEAKNTQSKVGKTYIYERLSTFNRIDRGTYSLANINIEELPRESFKNDRADTVFALGKNVPAMLKNTFTKNYQMYLKMNFCKEGTKKPSYFLKIAENIAYDGNLEVKCEKCGTKLAPIINLKSRRNYSEHSSELFSPLKIYKECNKIMEEFFSIPDGSKIDTQIVDKIVLNIMFYMENINDPNQQILGFLFNCLKK